MEPRCCAYSRSPRNVAILLQLLAGPHWFYVIAGSLDFATICVKIEMLDKESTNALKVFVF